MFVAVREPTDPETATPANYLIGSGVPNHTTLRPLPHSVWRRLGLSLVASTIVLGVLTGCGETYIDTSITTPPTGPATTAPPVTYNIDVPLADLLDQIKVLMTDLDQRILDERHPADALAAIDSMWAAARRQIEPDDPTQAEAFDQAIKLAHSGVEQRRPADASKGYKIYLDLLDHYYGT